MSLPRITDQTEQVFRAILSANVSKGLYGFEIGRAAGLASGTVHPILARWEKAGVLESYWEDPLQYEDKDRPRRRYYRFTRDGAEYVRHALATLDQSRRLAGKGFPVKNPIPVQG